MSIRCAILKLFEIHVFGPILDGKINTNTQKITYKTRIEGENDNTLKLIHTDTQIHLSIEMVCNCF